MMNNPIKQRLQDDMKSAMKAKDQDRLMVVRSVLAAIKQQEVDQRISLDEPQTLAVLEKAAKQRRESITQFKAANREDLVNKETFELKVIQSYLPEPLSEEEVDQIIRAAIKESGAISVRDMGNVMGLIKPKVQGRVDMGMLGNKVKRLLSEQG